MTLHADVTFAPLFEAPQIERREFKLLENSSKMFEKLRKQPLLKGLAITDLFSSGSLIARTINPETAFPMKFDAFSSNLDKETLGSRQHSNHEHENVPGLWRGCREKGIRRHV